MTDWITLRTDVRDLSDAELKRQSYAAAGVLSAIRREQQRRNAERVDRAAG